MNDEITAYGNSLAEKVLTQVDGKVGRVGAGEMEIRCDVVPGNSGGPVVLKGTGQVVGLVTRASWRNDDVWGRGTVFGGVRRFAARPTKVLKWISMSLYNLHQQSSRLDRIREDTRVLACVVLLNYHRDGGVGAGLTARGLQRSGRAQGVWRYQCGETGQRCHCGAEPRPAAGGFGFAVRGQAHGYPFLRVRFSGGQVGHGQCFQHGIHSLLASAI